MNIDFNKINEIYGEDILKIINENIEDVVENINYLKQLNFTDVEDIFERYTLLFIDNPSLFEGKINELIKEIGNNYVEVIESDLSLLDELIK